MLKTEGKYDMKKVIIILAFAAVFCLFGCKQNDNPDNEETTKVLESLETNYTLEIGEEKEIIVPNATINLESSDTDIVIIEGNSIKGVKEGEACVNVTVAESEEMVTLQITVNKAKTLSITSAPYNLHSNQTFKLAIRGDYTKDDVIWSSSDESIATVDESGQVTTISAGTCQIIAESKDGLLRDALDISVISYELLVNIEDETSDELYVGAVLQLKATITPSTLTQYTWTSSDNKIARVSDTGEVSILGSGEVSISVSATMDAEIKATISFNAIADPIKAMEYFNIATPYAKTITLYSWSSSVDQFAMGSVTKYLFDDLNIVDDICPLSSTEYVGQTATPELLETVEPLKLTRTGIVSEEIKYLIYHDTEGILAGNNPLNLGAYMRSSGNADNRARSWNYTVGDTYVAYHVPDGEVTWQGDSYDAYAKSIGIETCVNQGSDIEATWHRMGKLLASLMLKYDLGMDAIKQHYDMNGKNCPHTLRENDMYPYALSLVAAEYIMAKNFSDYTFTFMSNDPEFVNDQGRVINLATYEKNVSYTVTITNDSGYNESITLNSKLAAKTA